MKLFVAVFFTCALLSFVVPPAVNANDADPIIQNVVDHLKHDLTYMLEYGAHQRVVTTKLSDKGTPKRIEEKSFRTVWVQDKPMNELVHFTCNEFNDSGSSRRCSGLEKASFQKDAKPGKIQAEMKKVRWTDLHKNFQYSLLPPDGPYFVISFSPKGEPSSTNRIEKILSRMAGKVWVDRQFNLVKAEAELMNTVSFGLGVAAKVHHLAIHYRQQPFGSLWLPSTLTVDLKAKVALVYTERQRIEVFWTGPYRKSDSVWTQASPISGSTSSKR